MIPDEDLWALAGLLALAAEEEEESQDEDSIMPPVDPNMDTALQWANELGSPPLLPSSLQDVNQRAKLVDQIDGPLVRGSLLLTLNEEERQQRLRDVARFSEDYIPDVDDEMVRVNTALRLWAGCLAAAKTIALETRSGPNNPEMRTWIFVNKIDKIAQQDPIYLAGVEAAPAFKGLRNEPYSLEGVPEDCPVNKYCGERFES